MFRNIPRLVPWMNWDEWQSVHAQLYSTDIAERSLGVKKVAKNVICCNISQVLMWEARGRVPAAVIATADFVRLQAADKCVRLFCVLVG